MKTLYLDIFSGISGDMFIGAMIDLGADAHKLEHELEKLKLGGYHLHVARKQKSGIEGVKFDVHLATITNIRTTTTTRTNIIITTMVTTTTTVTIITTMITITITTTSTITITTTSTTTAGIFLKSRNSFRAANFPRG